MPSRDAQRRRTREAILAGARAVLSRGEPVSVAAAAAEHGISRATAYRYFSDASLLTAEAGLDVEVRPYEDIVGRSRSPRTKLRAIALYFFDLACAHETGFRRFLARNLDASLASARSGRTLRGARRVAMFERALEESGSPLPAAARARLLRALCAVTGIEALIALEDVAGADRTASRRTVEELVELILERHL